MKDSKQQILNLESDNLESIDMPVECLRLTFANDEERRSYFLKKLREGLEELHAKLGGVPFTTVEDAVERMKSVEKWPMPACRVVRGAGREADHDARAIRIPEAPGGSRQFLRRKVWRMFFSRKLITR